MAYPTSNITTTKTIGQIIEAKHVNELQGAAEMTLRICNNGSGSTRSVGDVGYIDEAGDFQTTTTEYLAANWAVVVVGGANGADVIVAIGGTGVTVTLDGNCSIGDFLYTSTTEGQATTETYVRSEIFGVALTANAAGAGGTCEALLLCNTTLRSMAPDYDVYYGANLSISDFVATIATLPGGAILTYNAPSSGDEANLVPVSTNQIAKMVLQNSTRSNDALISDCDTGTNTITLTANVPGTWQVGDTITIRSPVNFTQPTAGAYFVEFEFASDMDALARHMIISDAFADSAANNIAWFHPYQANASNRRRALRTQAANIALDWTSPPIPLIQSRFCLAWNASGANTVFHIIRLCAEAVAS